jgi:hypothetical protein
MIWAIGNLFAERISHMLRGRLIPPLRLAPMKSSPYHTPSPTSPYPASSRLNCFALTRSVSPQYLVSSRVPSRLVSFRPYSYLPRAIPSRLSTRRNATKPQHLLMILGVIERWVKIQVSDCILRFLCAIRSNPFSSLFFPRSHEMSFIAMH